MFSRWRSASSHRPHWIRADRFRADTRVCHRLWLHLCNAPSRGDRPGPTPGCCVAPSRTAQRTSELFLAELESYSKDQVCDPFEHVEAEATRTVYEGEVTAHPESKPVLVRSALQAFINSLKIDVLAPLVGLARSAALSTERPSMFSRILVNLARATAVPKRSACD